MKDNYFKRITKDYREFKKWPKWKQRIIISASSAMSGKFIGEK